MPATMNFSWDDLSRSMQNNLTNAITETIKDVESDAKRNAQAIRDTGYLQDSIYSGVKKKGNGPLGWCRSHAKYAGAVEYGHGSAQPKPLLRDALGKNVDKVADRFQVD